MRISVPGASSSALRLRLLLMLMLGLLRLQAQINCPDHRLYYPGSPATGNMIMGYDPSLPVSATNPINTGIPNPPLAALALLPNINGAGPSPTFYSVNLGNYIYWNGVAWTNTGHSTGNGNAVNIGGCGSYIYNLAGPPPINIYTYNGQGPGTFLTSIPPNSSADIVVDCDCNFYIFNAALPNQTLTKYSPTGVVLTTYTLIGIPNISGGPGFGIMGNDVYYPGGLNLYHGVIGPGSTITFSISQSAALPNAGGIGDYATCPYSASPIPASLSIAANVCQTATVVASTTVSPVSYSWSGPGIVGSASGSVISTSATGVYSCTLTGPGCPGGPSVYTIAVGPGPCISVTSNSITCASLGSATVTAMGGTGPFSYTWMPSAQTGPVATGLSPGVYTVTVNDQGGNFTYTTTTVFTSLIPITATVANSPSITCNAAATGSAQVTNTSGGSGSQTYQWSNGQVTYTVPNPTILSAGLWTYTVTDALTGCTASNAFNISQPPPMSATLSASSPSVCAGSTVALSGTVSGGSPITPPPAYTYSWTGGPAANGYTVSPLLPGNHVYSLTAFDRYGCALTQTININSIANPTLSVLNASICPLQTVTLIAVGASSYSWNGVPGPYTLVVSPVAATNYTITGEAAGCVSSTTISVIIMPAPVPMVAQNSPLCQGGILAISAAGGVSYVWTGPSGFNSTSAANSLNPVQMNQAGVYNVTLTAANTCTASASLNATVYPTPTLSASGSTVCTSQTLNLGASSVAGVTYTWSGPLGFGSGLQNISVANPSINQSGAYTVQATSINGCTNTAVALASVTSPPNLAVTLSSPSICAQALSGSPASIMLSGSGAATYMISTPGHIYNSSPGGPATQLGMLPPFQPIGPATATVVGSNGVCSVSTTAVFTLVPNPTVTLNNYTPVICAGQSFTYTSAGADSYTWSAATPGTLLYTTGNVAVANPSINAVFSVVGGSLGCNSALQTSLLTVNPLPELSINPSPAKVCLGSWTPLVVSGTGTTFTWSPSLGLNTINSATVQASPPAMQVYTVTAELNNCLNTSLVTVSVMALPKATISVPKTKLCINELLTMSGSGAQIYAWSGPTGFTGKGPLLELNATSTAFSGTYTLTITDENGCKDIATEQITVFDLPAGIFTSQELKGCTPFWAKFGFEMNSNRAPLSSASWLVNGQQFSGNTFSVFISSPGLYPVRGSVNDVNNCSSSFTASIWGYDKPIADFEMNPQLPTEQLDEVSFRNSSIGATQFSWFFGDHIHRSNEKDPRFVFENAGTYPIVLIARNAWGCADTAIKPLVVGPDEALYIPNAFTPNGDGLNDRFGPTIRGAQSFNLKVYDRWGELLFQTSDPNVAWDGSFKGQPCKQEIYVWVLEIIPLNGSREFETKQLNGHVMLYR